MKAFIALWLLVLLVAPEPAKGFPREENSGNVLKTWIRRKTTIKPTKITSPTTTTTTTTTTPSTTVMTPSIPPTTPGPYSTSETTMMTLPLITPETTIMTLPPISPETTIMTLPPTTSWPLPTCLPGESSITKHDLKFLINDEAKGSTEAFEQLKESLSKEAEQVYGKHMMELKDFIQQTSDEPRHLEHVIQSVVNRRDKLQPLIKNLNTTFLKQAKVFDDFRKLEDNAQKLLNSFSTCEKLYETCLNIIRSEPSDKKTIKVLKKPFKLQPDTEEIYCGKLSDIKHQITSSIRKSLNKAETEGHKLIKDYDENIGQNISSFKDSFKDLAFSKFGLTVYYITKLMDEHAHLKDDVDEISTSTKQKIRDLRRSISDVQIHIEETSDEIRRLQIKCVECSSHLKRIEKLRKFRTLEMSEEEEDTSTSDDDVLPPRPKDILEYLLEELNALTHHSIFIMLKTKFDEIDNMLKDGSSKYINAMNPVQKKVEEIIIKEKQMFDELKQSFPTKQIAEIRMMPNSVNKIKKEVDEIAEKLKKMDYTLN